MAIMAIYRSMNSRCFHPRVFGSKLFPCGKCPACLAVRKEELAQRLYIEALTSRAAYFVTLTYDDENLPFAERDFNCFDKAGIQHFLRSLRDFFRPKGLSLRYFVTCEYGDRTNRSHYHLLLYLSDFLSLQQIYIVLKEKWGKGNVYVSSVGVGCAKYCAKYCLKDDGTDELDRHDPNKPWRLFSRRPGLGCTPAAIKYYEDTFSLSSKFISPVGYLYENSKLCKKVPRTVRNHLPPETREKISRVGWSKFYEYASELELALLDPSLNFYDGKNFHPIYEKDLEIKEKTRKLRKLKKKCL